MLTNTRPLLEGAASALGLAAFSAIAMALAPRPQPSPEFFRTLAAIGASFLLGYVVQAAWVVQRIERDSGYDRWLGFVVGTGLAGLLGVAFALLISEHRAVGHDNVLDDLGLGWAVISLSMLGGILVVQPLFAHRFRSESEDESRE